MRRTRVHEEPKLASDVPISKGFSTANKLTIWQKSLLFNGRGYTVYDNSTGELIFRVDNYASDWRVEMFLMDSTGNVLFTIKRSRKKLSFLERWEVFRGEVKDQGKPFIKATKAFGVASCKVSSAAGDEYEMRWSAQEGWSRIYQMPVGTLLVAEVNRKLGKATPGFLLGKDVYSLSVYPGMDQSTAMALVMINDAMR
ncbi:hypothetical protein VitviT2T_009520 [Vitis vinifera]|uniref:Protein LURP-one-related 12 n=2 Tax=Vitis vinifera TaxID=29760 RepID=A0A438KGV2_VITVI|nr:protein LURP-one-related 12 [Vitis vinifera]RVW54623.1 Protein LURP-one-related 12 [Vitis vinifera]RVX20432.1 Protein LURP-one-related 12 [Vitis vinifera]WJZ90372.1 hypothetical protein VitviT2T_009520 [Vitis vinifera]|eukprot:XP_010652199.1 PREDICTED: protein LURP-one-related 12-like [Vitis vinifera]